MTFLLGLKSRRRQIRCLFLVVVVLISVIPQLWKNVQVSLEITWNDKEASNNEGYHQHRRGWNYTTITTTTTTFTTTTTTTKRHDMVHPQSRFSPIPNCNVSSSSSSSSSSCSLPVWMQKYMAWHRKRLDQILQGLILWRDQPLLVVRCIDADRCGGTADRLKGLPLYLAVAAKTRRLLFLRWNRPFALEEFMIPAGPHNWTVPTSLSLLFLERERRNDTITTTNKDNSTLLFKRRVFGGTALQPMIKAAHNPNVWLIESAAQFSGGSLFQRLVQSLEKENHYYNDDEENDEHLLKHDGNNTHTVVDIQTIFHDLFLTMFQPTPTLRVRIETYMEQLDLWPNQFVTAHIRAKHPGEPYRETQNVTLLKRTVWNAIDCASSLVVKRLPQAPPPSSSSSFTTISNNGNDKEHNHHKDNDKDSSITTLPVYVASDALVSLQAAQEYVMHNSKKHSPRQQTQSIHYLSSYPRVVSHLNVASWSTTNIGLQSHHHHHQDPPHLNFAQVDHPSAFFSIFVDLFLMSQSRCVTFGAGGFGRFGSMVSFNASCRIAHSHHGVPNPNCTNLLPG